MKQDLEVAVVTAYPPSQTTLNEYGYHLCEQLASKREIKKLHLLTETGHDYHGSGEKVHFHPCWQFNSLLNSLRLFNKIRKLKPNAVIINLQFLLFGDSKIAGALGLLLPLLLRVSGIKSIVLLHNILEEVDLNKAGFTNNPILRNIYLLLGNLLTRIILSANLVGVTIEKYVDVLQSKYKAKNVVLIPHGTFDIPEYTNLKKSNSKQTIMTFGKFGTYKKVETLINAFINVTRKFTSPLELVIAGTNNPNAPGYLENIQERYSDIPNIKFTGYVEEPHVPQLFHESDMVVFPYASTTGSSGVLHQAGSFGKAVVLPKIGDLQILIEEEGYSGVYFEPENEQSLTDAIKKLLENKSYCSEIGQQNFEAAHSLRLKDISDWYIIHISNLNKNK